MNHGKVWAICIGTLVLHGIILAFSWHGFYSYLADIARYQTTEDQNHNKTTQDLEICQAQAVINHATNWKMKCVAFGLPESCGLPSDDYKALAAGLKAETEECVANHQYQFPTEVGPAFDSQGHLLNRSVVVPSLK